MVGDAALQAALMRPSHLHGVLAEVDDAQSFAAFVDALRAAVQTHPDGFDHRALSTALDSLSQMDDQGDTPAVADRSGNTAEKWRTLAREWVEAVTWEA